MRQGLKYTLAVALFFLTPGAAFAFVVDSQDKPEDAGDFVVVLDPGHGGPDAGAVGPGGTLEKDLVLSVAKKAGETLQKTPGIKVLFTRTDDTFVTLAGRTVFANDNKADVFVSIHANAAKRKAAVGVETFFLSLDATDDEARLTAAYENAGVSMSFKYGEDNDEVREILVDLENNVAHHLSAMLAETIQSKVFEAAGKENRGVKQAPFVVLYGAAMPAVLVEIGFVSNKAEEKRLASVKEQERIAASITDGITAFKKTAGKKFQQAEATDGAKKN
ncbi:MAG: N-acetylmuramoyl-L-alanine amidase [Deltaproteobacteria bacterium]|nr:N-acetylmuramoyl-L-alanine amidase [Deltaproteobacteria bacterium]